MNNRSPILIFLSIIMLSGSGSLVIAADEPPVNVPVDCSEEALIALKDPFASQLPLKSLTKTDPLTKPVGSKSSSKESPDSSVSVSKPLGKPKPGEVTEAIKPVASSRTPQLALTGIIFDTAKPKAIINGAVLGIGDRIEGAVLKTIRKGIVEVQYEGEVIRLKME